MRPPHILVNILCLVLVELDIVLLMSTPSAGAAVLQENQRRCASVVCVCVCLEANGNMSPEEGFILLEVSLFRPETSLKNDQVSLTPDIVTCGVILLL